MAGLYTSSLFIYTWIGMFLSLLHIHEKPFQLLGLFFTRKFKPAKAYHKYAILIPARNEEAVIGNLIESIREQDYPAELITVFVAADNCTDHTAEKARSLGAIVYEHHNPQERTKGYALKYLFEQIRKDYGIEFFEGYFIFDADNLLKQDYISRMNDSFDAGEKLITSYRSTKNLDEGWIASLYAIHWLQSIRFRHRPRSFLHLATNIQGTGFLFANEIVKDGWKYTSLTEDRALTADCVVNGYEISYNNEAIFYDEQPTAIRVALRQRLRWAKGHLQAFAESGPGLFLAIFIDRHSHWEEGEPFCKFLLRTIRHRFMAFDTFAQLLPKQIVTAFRWLLWKFLLYSFYLTMKGKTISLLSNSTWLSHQIVKLTGKVTYTIVPGWQGWFTCLILLIWIRFFWRLGSYLGNIWVAVYVLIIEHKRIQKIPVSQQILYCFTWPLYDVIERYVKYIALFKKVEWQPIPHTSKITIHDLK